ncbi:hypothetical protein BFR40_07255 [Brochothrix thermosphacta]|uniref:hypothetical protein n=1 Tax=Brochothrix thermosphacta TaxID=2756 RepID=UPI00083FC95D|nr:hypothetical protein [Brochothrix thermosphacta]ODJ51789.1 hypothetical protein BFR40_07255 [Brochothrix thermosphacta]
MYKDLLIETSATILGQVNMAAEVVETLENEIQPSSIVATKFLNRLTIDLDEGNVALLNLVDLYERESEHIVIKALEETADLLSDTTSDMNDIENLLMRHGSTYIISIVKTLEGVRQSLNRQHMAILYMLLKNTKSEVSQ